MEKILDEYLYRRNAFTQALFRRPDSLSRYFVYDEYLENQRIYVNRDGSFGAIFEVDLVEHEPLNGEEVIERIAGIRPWFNLPSNCVLQIIHDQAAVSPRDRLWEEIRSRYPLSSKVSEEILEERIEQFKSLCKTDSDLRPMVRRTFVCVKYYPAVKVKKRLKALPARSEDFLFSQVKEATSDIKGFSEILEILKSASKLRLEHVTPPGLLDSLRRFLNPKEYYERDFMGYNPNASISDQLLFTSPKLNFSSFEREGVKSKSIVLKVCPRRSTPGAVAAFLALPFPFRICMNFSFPDKIKVNRALDLKAFFLQNTPSAGARRLKGDLDQVQEKIAHGDKCLNMTLTLVVEGETDDDLNRRVREIVNVFHRDLEAEVLVDENIGLGLCLNTLPLMYSPEADFSSQRHIKILDSEVLNFIPIFDSYSGNGDPLQLYLSRESNVVSFSFDDKSRPSQHSIVIGDTGSGKSEFVLDITQAYKRRYPDPIIFYIEKRASSKRLAELFGGEVTLFHPNQDLPFTPFRGHFDDTKVNVLSLIVLTAIKLTSPKFEAESEHSAILIQALKDAYKRKCEQAGLVYEDGKIQERHGELSEVMSMDDVVAAIGDLHDNESFRSLSPQIDEMLQKLRDFHGDGKYAGYFKGNQKSVRDGECRFYVYDLDPLESDPILKAIITLSVFEEIKRIIALPENQGRGGIIVFEEFGQLGGKNPTAARYIEDFAETIRKLKFWLIGIAPNPKVFFETDPGKAMWAAADNFFFLNMKPDSVEYVRSKSEILNGPPGDIVKSLATRPGQFAEVFYTDKAAKSRGAFRFIQSRPLSTYSEPKEKV